MPQVFYKIKKRLNTSIEIYNEFEPFRNRSIKFRFLLFSESRISYVESTLNLRFLDKPKKRSLNKQTK
ncbi:hypothetical protein LEP1GSC132_0978 [Leptospira kirschneri str. 200803703]|uniref:Uncharacterized protein n=2 Tax=Leptospira kirschneri TaxID=29507 RepID=A0A1T1DH92_9LEPT|nr:hypothetical protein LEP1GSC131_3806 [Leptospira kirschneri str. 200802841]EKP06233.1 hypothetical protein LEP1GSC018_1955 [Leptospira kirschneri str. 2008720114]EMO66190.1 hypothetical protein LEP1GSC132_0978 [Leptospira kirschneri str. 200803703]EMO78328.1 hypothetical protein LEP1GSC127_2067 [Leptospira kirschneri str. 200801925]OOV39933.1 hypothetical protein B1J93_20365 [Leptospira kirschneri serovar Pomona]